MLGNTLIDESSALVTWPDHLGVEGVSARAARALDGDAAAARALAALRGWLPGPQGEAGAAGLPDAARPDAFPFAEVLAHYHAVGRTHADPVLTGWLRALDTRLRQSPGGAGPSRSWPLAEWLPSTVDQETGNYDSYVVAPLLESLTDPAGAHLDGTAPVQDTGEADDETIDALLGALAADLARIEATALRLAPPTPLQLQRTRGCLVVLNKLGELAPRWAQRPVPTLEPVGSRSDLARLADATGLLAEEVWGQSPAACRRAVELSLLPTTPLHDELMFIRSIQIFETLYRQIFRCLVRAGAAMQEGDVLGARAELADATRRLGLSPALYRVVTTMPRPAFATIRAYTDGRSAIQSRPYRQIQLFCAPQPPSPVAGKLPAVHVPAPTLQELFLALAARRGPETEPLAAQMRALDAGWRAMKRTHWGITLKIIGTVPGTGGTAGADYLKRAAEIPLFPALAP